MQSCSLGVCSLAIRWNFRFWSWQNCFACAFVVQYLLHVFRHLSKERMYKYCPGALKSMSAKRNVRPWEGTGGEVSLENQSVVVAGCTSSWWWEEKSRDSSCVVGMEGDWLVSFLSLWQMSEKNRPTRRFCRFCPTLGACLGDHFGTIAFGPVVRQPPWPWGCKAKGFVYLMLTRKWKRDRQKWGRISMFTSSDNLFPKTVLPLGPHLQNSVTSQQHQRLEHMSLSGDAHSSHGS